MNKADLASACFIQFVILDLIEDPVNVLKKNYAGASAGMTNFVMYSTEKCYKIQPIFRLITIIARHFAIATIMAPLETATTTYIAPRFSRTAALIAKTCCLTYGHTSTTVALRTAKVSFPQTCRTRYSSLTSISFTHRARHLFCVTTYRTFFFLIIIGGNHRILYDDRWSICACIFRIRGVYFCFICFGKVVPYIDKP